MIYTRKQKPNIHESSIELYGLWEEELKALENLKSGKMKVTKESGKNFLEVLRQLIYGSK